MAFDQEELQRRRLQREKARAARKAKQRKNLILLAIIAAAVMLVAAVTIVILISAGGKKRDNTEATRKPGEITTVRLSAAGDLNITDRTVGSGGTELDYTDAFLDVAHLLGEADVTVMNLEGVLTGAPYGDSRSAPQAMLEALSNNGVDLLQLANSYSIHKGVSGLGTTIGNVRGAGMSPLGVYANRAEYRRGKGFVLCEVKGVKIAFVAFTKGMDGMALPAGSDNCVNVLYKDYASAYQEVDTEGIAKIMENAAEANPDLTVALVHWGSEYNDNISKTQETIRDTLLENGADAIIGTHSHYVQKMELDPETGTFIAYSLGDFMGDTQRAGSEYSVILDLEITKNNRTGETKIKSYDYHPIFTVNEKDKPMRVVRIESAMKAHEIGYIDAVNKETYAAMEYALKRIEARVKGE